MALVDYDNVRESTVDRFFNKYKLIICLHEKDLYKDFPKDLVLSGNKHRPIVLDCVTYYLLIDDKAYKTA